MRIFNPAIKFMNLFTFPKKFMIIFFLFMIPLVFLSFNMINALNKEIDKNNKQIIGLEFINSVREVIKYTQQHRGLSALYVGGNHSIKPQILEKQKQLEVAYSKVDQLKEKYEETLVVSEKWDQIIDKWNSLETNLFELKKIDDSNSKHKELIDEMTSIVADVADSSKLSLENTMEYKYLIDAVVFDFPIVIENMGQARALGSGIAAKKSIISSEKVKLANLNQNIQSAILSTKRGMNIVYEQNASLKTELHNINEKGFNASNDLVNTIQKDFIDAKQITYASDKFFDFATNSIDQIYSLLEFESKLLAEKLDERIDGIKFHKNMVLSLILGILVVIIYLFIAFFSGVRTNIEHIRNSVNKMASGDFSSEVEIKTKDETSLIAHSLNQMAKSLREMIVLNQDMTKEVTVLATHLSEISNETKKITNEVSHSISNMSDDAVQQYEGAKETTNAMEEMSLGIQQVAVSSTHVAQAASQMNEKALDGNKIVNESVKQMISIKENTEEIMDIITYLDKDSSEIGNIIGMITNISEQTNLLALNATIEAARAGEHGTGFAVVAGEVRKLAEQSAQSSSKIKELIERIQMNTSKAVSTVNSGKSKVEDGIGKNNQVGNMFTDILISIESVVNQIDEVSAVSEEMSAGSEEVLASVEEMASISRKTSQGASDINELSQKQLEKNAEINQAIGNLEKMTNELNIMLGKFIA